jgi:hypothetical protein
MRKLAGVLIVLTLTVFAALPVQAYPPYRYCENWMTCPDFLDCRLIGCINHACEYDCSW